MDHLNWIDYVILGIFGLSIIAGFARGLVKEIISLLTLVAAFIVATLFASPLAVSFTQSDSVQNVVNQASNTSGMDVTQSASYAAIGLSFAVLFAATLLIGALIGSVFNMVLQTSVLGIGNRIFGAAFGFCRAFIINLVLIFVIQLTSFASDPVWQDSQLVARYQPAVAWLGAHVSPVLENIKERMQQKTE